MHHYAPLAARPMRETVLAMPQNEPHAQMHDPATVIFTDFRAAPCVIVPSGEALGPSLRLMQLAGVRMAFVTAGSGEVIGLVTAADLSGERPVQVAIGSGRSRDDLAVADVMTPVADFNALDADVLRRSRVGDVVETFRATGERYLIVLEAEEATGRTVVRGVFSASRAERALGHSIVGELRSRSFSQLAAALSHG